ncbi:MAG TPA: hypothetical protein VFV61_06830 [Pyrinomonadaceae bacterium]|nr:hypothetical protein [Pyrinomonadaceae bacterium]
MIDDFGARVASIWSELRPTTRGLVERALKLPSTSPLPGRNLPYDARADLELSRLLSALDDRAAETSASPATSRDEQLRRLADTCAAVLQEKTQSAEVFTQLIKRAGAQRDYARIDSLADELTRFAPSEICELARSEDLVARALANEALAQCPTGVLVALLSDLVDSEIARQALRRQALEFGSEEARQIVTMLDQVDAADEEFQ